MDNCHLAGNGGEIKGLVMPWHIYGWSKIGRWDRELWPRKVRATSFRRCAASSGVRDVARISFILGRNPALRDGNEEPICWVHGGRFHMRFQLKNLTNFAWFYRLDMRDPEVRF